MFLWISVEKPWLVCAQRMLSRIDLHIHSTASDGRLTPAEVATMAASRGLHLFALTDHDTTHGYAEARAEARHSNIRVVAGVEINTDSSLGEAHLLGYFSDPEKPTLQAVLSKIRTERLNRAEKMVAKLNGLGLPITLGQVLAQASHRSLGRPHVARALVAGGWVASVPMAFELYLGSSKPAYVPRYAFSPEEAIRLIRSAGGVASLAHPVRSGSEKHLPGLVEAGLNAVEAYYYDHTPDDTARLRGLARRYGLLCTGGSDFHDILGDSRRGLGSVWVPEEDGERLWEEIAS